MGEDHESGGGGGGGVRLGVKGNQSGVGKRNNLHLASISGAASAKA